MTYESVKVVESQIAPGVQYTVALMSFTRRLDLMRRVRELARQVEFVEAGHGATAKMDGALLKAEIDRLYVMWGLRQINGLTIDGAAATPELLSTSGPEGLFREVLGAVRRETGITEEERKN